MRKTARRDRQVAAEEEEAGGGALAKTLQLGALFGLWYLCGIYYNICIKQVLKPFPYPLNITTLQFAVGTAISLFMWITGILRKPKISCAQLAVMLPLAMVHALFTNMRFQAVGVSFTHRLHRVNSVKPVPLFSNLLTVMFLREWHTMWVVMTVVQIVGGVALASISEASLTGNRDGSLSTMAPNVTFQSSNVLSKKLALNKEESLDNINLFSIITVMSFLFLAPVTLLEEFANFSATPKWGRDKEGLMVTPSFLQSAGLNLQEIYGRSLIASFCFHAYQQLSYILLARVLSPATQSSLNNFVKHMVLIVTSVLFLRTHVIICLPFTFFGTVGALAGVFLYSQLKRLTKPKAV